MKSGTKKSQLTIKRTGNALLNIHVDEALVKDGVKVFTRSPSGIQREFDIDRKSGIFTSDFIPDEIGDWTFSVIYQRNGSHVDGSPFDIRVHDQEEVFISNLIDGLVDCPCYFDVDASNAGPGSVDIKVTHNNDAVRSSLLMDNVKGVHRANFTPQRPGLHQVEVFFEGSPVTGSPFICDVIGLSDISMKVMGLDFIKVDDLTSFEIVFGKDIKDSYLGNLDIEILSPKNTKLPFEVTMYSTKSFIVEFTPAVPEIHEISVLYYGKHITGSPFRPQVIDSSDIVISPTNQIGTVGEPLTVIVNTNKAGDGKLDVRVWKGDEEVKTRITEAGPGMNQVTFTPNENKPHEIKVTSNGKNYENYSLVVPVIDRSLFQILGEGVSYAAINQPSTFKVIGSNLGHGNLSVDITSMVDGTVVPSVIKNCSENDEDGMTYDVEYITRKIGDYRVEVRYGNSIIGEGPFVIKSFDPTKVQVLGLVDAIVGTESKFIVDANNAGEGNMVISIELAGNRDLKCSSHVDVEGSEFKVRFMPQKGGRHRVNVYFNDRPIAGSPFAFNVLDLSSIVLKITNALQGMAPVNKIVNLYLKAQNVDFEDLKINVKGPNNESVPVGITMSTNDSQEINFLPTSAGEHHIKVTYKDQPITGFSQILTIWDISKIKVSEIGIGRIKEATSFEVDARKAGSGQLEVITSNASGKNIPIRLNSTGPGEYSVIFTPVNLGQHWIDVKFNQNHVPGSPFRYLVIGESMIKVQGHTEANKQTSFDIRLGSMPQINERDLSIKIFDSSGDPVNHQLQSTLVNDLKVYFTPKQAGQHKVEVKWLGNDLGDGPFIVEVFDPSKVKAVSSLPQFAKAFEPISFYVDTSQAGKGQLQVEVKGPTSNYLALPTQVLSSSSTSPHGKVKASFELKEAGNHEINVLYEGRHIKGSPFRCEVVDPNKCVAQWSDVKCIPANKKARLEVNFNQPLTNDVISASVIDPTGNRLPISLLPLDSSNRKSARGAVLEFCPITAGRYEIKMSVLDSPIPGSTFISDVFDVSNVQVEGLPEEIQLEKPIEFYVRTSGPGEITTKVKSQGERSSKVVVACKKLSPGLTKHLFTPVDESDHVVELSYNNQLIPGFPKILKVFNPDLPKPSPVEVSSQYESFNREMTSATQTNLNGNYDKAQVIVTAPNGQKVKGQLTRQSNGDYKVDYASPHVGRHNVEVILDGDHIMDTPYYVDLHDASKVDIISAKQKWLVNRPVDFEVVTNKAGIAPLKVKVIEPNGNSIPIDEEATQDGRRVIYTPMSVGPHRAFVTFGGESVPGGNPLVQEVIKPSQATALGSGLTKGLKDEPSRFFVDGKNQKGDLTVQVDGPNSVAKVNIESVQHGAYNVTYIPVEVGHFDVFVRWNGRDINGSPFRPKIVDPSKVKVSGGLDKVFDSVSKVMNLRVGEVNKIELDTKSAGPGELTAEVMNLRSRLNVPVDVVKLDEDKFMVALVPTEEGDHLIRILWEDHLIPICPITSNAKDTSSFLSANQMSQGSSSPMRSNNILAAKVAVLGRALKEAMVGQMAEFIIDATDGGQGKPKVKLSDGNMEIPIKVQCINKSLYKCSYQPILPGKYMLSVDWLDESIKGSPFEVNISTANDASKVVCTGEGLKKAILNQDVRAMIDTSQARPGSLETWCIGPSTRATTTLRDNRDGGTHTLFIKPHELGKHLLEIKYAGRHVAGSPFHIKVYPPPDPSEVTVCGPGVRHGLLENFRGHFFVDTTGAGAGQLTVRVKGPKGAFCVEMQRDSQKDRLITCRYDPSEKGEYIVQVKWSDMDIPGSPFLICIVDTKEELDEALRTIPTPAMISPNESHKSYSYPKNSKIVNADLLDRMSKTGEDAFVKKA